MPMRNRRLSAVMECDVGGFLDTLDEPCSGGLEEQKSSSLLSKVTLLENMRQGLISASLL